MEFLRLPPGLRAVDFFKTAHMPQENAMDNAAITAQEERSLLKQKVRGAACPDWFPDWFEAVEVAQFMSYRLTLK